MHGEFALLVNLSASLVVALAGGLIAQRLHLSPIVGYIAAGIALGPHVPGFVADPQMAAALAEIGVVLLMFGVGLHFNLRDLLSVRRIAVPGAAGQILAATALGALLIVLSGQSWTTGVLAGLAISVASTVVLVRMLVDHDLLQTTQGHIAVGWLIVEDIFTVIVLVALPAFASLVGASLVGPHAGADQHAFLAVFSAVGKVLLLGLIVVGGGRIVIPHLLRHVAGTRSRELFTLTVLALALAIATGSAVGFGVSMALGAFLAGMVVGQTEVSHQAAADALPMRDAFAVLFFVSVGMLFDPSVLLHRPWLLLGLLGIVLLVKPFTAFLIVWQLRYSVRTALTVAVALAQIGEFSFLLADEACRQNLFPAEERSLLVACALASIAVNPLLFRLLDPAEKWLRNQPRLWRMLSQRSEARGAELNCAAHEQLSTATGEPQPESAVIVGFGPVGQTAVRILREFGVRPVVVDLNLDTVRRLVEAGDIAVYGDATQRNILEVAGIQQAKYLLVTIPEVLARTVVVLTATDLNPNLRVFARARYLQERAWLMEVGATAVVTEEGETAIGLAVLLLQEMGAEEGRISTELRRIKAEMAGGGPVD
jgi:CPA2 family monovalent cation:H+ antiporter-2